MNGNSGFNLDGVGKRLGSAARRLPYAALLLLVRSLLEAARVRLQGVSRGQGWH